MSSPKIDDAVDQTPPSALTKRLNLIGLAITGVWLLLMFSYALAVWDNLLAMKPNEFGDLLAGTFAPLHSSGLCSGSSSKAKNFDTAVVLSGCKEKNFAIRWSNSGSLSRQHVNNFSLSERC